MSAGREPEIGSCDDEPSRLPRNRYNQVPREKRSVYARSEGDGRKRWRKSAGREVAARTRDSDREGERPQEETAACQRKRGQRSGGIFRGAGGNQNRRLKREATRKQRCPGENVGTNLQASKYPSESRGGARQNEAAVRRGEIETRAAAGEPTERSEDPPRAMGEKPLHSADSRATTRSSQKEKEERDRKHDPQKQARTGFARPRPPAPQAGTGSDCSRPSRGRGARASWLPRAGATRGCAPAGGIG